MAVSDTTKKYRKKYWITLICSWLLTIGPSLIFFFKGFAEAETHTKVCMSLIMILAIIMAVLMALMKVKLKRTLFWLLLLGAYFGLHSMATVMIVMAICNVIDEVFVSPYCNHCKDKLSINKEIDKRC